MLEIAVGGFATFIALSSLCRRRIRIQITVTRSPWAACLVLGKVYCSDGHRWLLLIDGGIHVFKFIKVSN
jgi:hypothetical protein